MLKGFPSFLSFSLRSNFARFCAFLTVDISPLTSSRAIVASSTTASATSSIFLNFFSKLFSCSSLFVVHGDLVFCEEIFA